MNIHKFNVKPIYTQTKTIKWMIPNETRQYVKKVNTTTWEIFSQEDIFLISRASILITAAYLYGKIMIIPLTITDINCCLFVKKTVVVF